jgi:hypothetical protein
MKSSLSIVMAALLLAAQPWNQAEATVFIDLNFSGDTAKNSGVMGDGNVGLHDGRGTFLGAGTGAWENVNATGNPAGRAYKTGASVSGSGTGNGTISWISAKPMEGITTLTFYAWVKPSALMEGGRLWSWGSGRANALIQVAGDGTMRLNTVVNSELVGSSLSFGPADSSVLGKEAISKWLFVGVTYDSVAGTLTGYVGRAEDEYLASESREYSAGALTQAAVSGLTLLNSTPLATNNRPFAGSLGAFYLSDEKVDFKAIFNAQKAAFKAVSK